MSELAQNMCNKNFITVIESSVEKRQLGYKFGRQKQHQQQQQQKQKQKNSKNYLILITILSFAESMTSWVGTVVVDIRPLALRSSLVGIGRVARTSSTVWGAFCSLRGSLGVVGG